MKAYKLLLSLFITIGILVSCEFNLDGNQGDLVDQVDKSDLIKEIEKAEALVDSVEVGESVGDVLSQSDIDTFILAIETAQAVADSSDVTDDEVFDALIELSIASSNFKLFIIEFEHIAVDGVNGRQILVDDEPFYMKGVCWNPVGKGGDHPWDLDFSGYVEQDAALMAAAGINTIRTYEPLTDEDVLNTLYANGIYVINTVYVYGGTNVNTVTDIVNATKDHPAILMWAIGNEWNYNGFYTGLSSAKSLQRINEASVLVKEADTTHPVTTIYGGMPTESVYKSLPNIDVWGINYYSGLTFEDVFTDWEVLSDKPMFMAEYGADSYDATANGGAGGENEAAQAEATTVLTQLLMDNSSVTDSTNVCSGGTIFEWADEWWKDMTDGQGTNLSVQDTGGAAPGGGPYPDAVFNEEFWGIVDIDRNPKPAYYALQTLFVE